MHHHHHHQSLNCEGCWGTTDDFATTFLHFSLFSTALWDFLNSRPVHSLMLSSHLFLCPPCLLPPFTVPCKMVLARPDERETWPYHCSLCLSWAGVHVESLVCDSQGQGHNKGSYYQNMTISTASSKLLILLLPLYQTWFDSVLIITIGQSTVWRNWFSVFKVQVTAKFQNVNECLSRWYLLNCWTFYNWT